MCGDYNSVIGMKKELSIKRFTQKHLKTRLEPLMVKGTLCGTILDIESKSVKAFEQIILGVNSEKIKMAGHSKFKNIMHEKVLKIKRAKLFSRLIREISVSAN